VSTSQRPDNEGAEVEAVLLEDEILDMWEGVVQGAT
jgi:hypothetical protein